MKSKVHGNKEKSVQLSGPFWTEDSFLAIGSHRMFGIQELHGGNLGLREIYSFIHYTVFLKRHWALLLLLMC